MIQVFVETKGNTQNESQFIKYILTTLGIEHTLIMVHGKDNLKQFANIFKKRIFEEKRNIVIFDADTTNKNGGFSKRKQEIENLKQQYDIDFDLFLWPNNHDDGTFEDVLLHSIKLEHKHILDCFDKFENCIKQHNTANYPYTFHNDKSKIYTYKELLQGHRDARNWRFDNEKYWDFNNDYIKALKDFLLQYK